MIVDFFAFSHGIYCDGCGQRMMPGERLHERPIAATGDLIVCELVCSDCQLPAFITLPGVSIRSRIKAILGSLRREVRAAARLIP